MSQKHSKFGKNIPGLFVRQQAAIALTKVLAGNSFEPLDASKIEDSRDRALINRLISTALRRHGHLNVIIKNLMQRGIPKRSGLFEAILRLGLVQLLFLEKMGEHSAIHLAVEAAKQDRRAGRFDRVLNGVLRQAQRDAGRWRGLEAKLLFPHWLADKWTQQFNAEVLESFGEALLAGAPLDLTLKQDDCALIEQLAGIKLGLNSIRVEQRASSVDQMAGFEKGQWWVQDVAAALPARLFSLKNEAKILDMCAAPGGKTAQLVNAGFDVTALDNSPGRIKRMAQNFARLGFELDVVEGDARTYRGQSKFDGILIDAPCTATGTFRRHPEVLWHRTKEDVLSRVKLQQDIIGNAVECLKRGGELILCVCSLLEEEGEAQANWVLENFPQLRVVPIQGHEIGNIEGAISPQGWVRTHSGLQIGAGTNKSMDGFFVARWRNDLPLS